MALVTSAQFNTYLTPVGQTAPPPQYQLPINLGLSDGTSVLVFDRLTTALSLMEAMRLRGQWLLQLNDDIAVAAISATKLLLFENTLVNRRLITSYLPVYAQGDTRFYHRNLSQTAVAWDALAQSGLCWRGVNSVSSNADLTQANALVIDWYYPNTTLDDANAIRYTLP